MDSSAPRLRRLISGKNTMEYKVVHSLITELSLGIQDGFITVVTAAFEAHLISDEAKRSLLNSQQDLHDRSNDFISRILTRMELDANSYHVFVSILQNQPHLHILKEKMENKMSELANGNRNYSSSVEPDSEARTHLHDRTLKPVADSARVTESSIEASRYAEVCSLSHFEVEHMQNNEASSTTPSDVSPSEGGVFSPPFSHVDNLVDSIGVPPTSTTTDSARSEQIVSGNFTCQLSPLDRLRRIQKELEQATAKFAHQLAKGEERERDLKEKVKKLEQQRNQLKEELSNSNKKLEKTIEERNNLVMQYEERIKEMKGKISQKEQETERFRSQSGTLEEEVRHLTKEKRSAEEKGRAVENELLRDIIKLQGELAVVEGRKRELEIKLEEEKRRNAELQVKLEEEKRRTAEKRFKCEQKRRLNAEKAVESLQKRQCGNPSLETPEPAQHNGCSSVTILFLITIIVVYLFLAFCYV